MPPDLNSVPPSPRQQRARISSQASSTANSRRPSQVGPTHGTSPGPAHSPVFAHSEQSGMPLRHPRPMTAAELHLELEKEQEAVVNRLTRELSVLRAQHSASVASNHSITSSSSAAPSLLPVDPADPNPNHQIIGPTHPTPSRRHRSSSNTSAVSGRGASGSVSSTTTPHPASVPHHGQSQASADRAAAAGTPLSRNPSISASGASTPARQLLADHHTSGSNLTLPHRPSLSQAVSFTSQNTSSTHATQGSSNGPFSPVTAGATPTSAPYHPPLQYGIDADRARIELDAVKQENETLKDKIRTLERALRQRRRESSASDVSSVSGLGPGLVAPTSNAAPRGQTPAGEVNVSAWAAGAGSHRDRSESQSTEAGLQRQLAAQEDRDDVVKVGESAGNSGLA